MLFRQHRCACYYGLDALEGRGREKPPSNTLTAAFLLQLDELWPGGPGLVGAFGMNGLSTLVRAYRLARDFDWLLAEPGFTMVEMDCADVPDRPTDLLWANGWQIEVVIAHRPG